LSVVHLNPLKDHVPLADPSLRRNVDIVVPIYKCVSLASRCLDSLIAHIDEISQLNPRLIVINDSPEDVDVGRMLKAFASGHPNVTILGNDANLGFVRTANRGLDIALKAGRDALLVNADTETFPGTLQTLIDVAYSDAQIGFVSPRSNNASICTLPHCFGGAPADPAESYRRWKLLSRTLPMWHPGPTAVGFYLFIKHVVMANFGFMDPDFGLGYEEENDLILRANKVGYRAVIANHAFAYHVGSASFALHDVNLNGHRELNLQKMAQRHPEFLPLVSRYEGSAHFRAEILLGNLLVSPGGRLKIVFDFSTVGPNVNGTSELSAAILTAFHKRHAGRYDINVICSKDAFAFHKLNLLEGVRRHDPKSVIPERFAIGVNLGQPFTTHQISTLEDLAVINIYGMLDTIAEDCGYLSITHRLDMLWGHVARHANGLFFISECSERAFLARHDDARNVRRYARLLPTKLSSYKKNTSQEGYAEHILILGNHFAHKASESTANLLRSAFPTVAIAVLGGRTGVERNMLFYRSGSLDQHEMESLYNRAGIVVLPSHAEGFGFGLMHALAARKVVVARDIPVTREILARYQRVGGVFLYSDDGDLVRAMKAAMGARHSEVDDSGSESWGSWVDGFEEFCVKLTAEDNVFERLVNRIRAGDLIRKSDLLERMQTGQAVPSAGAVTAGNEDPARFCIDEGGRKWNSATDVDNLLDLGDKEFVYTAYVTLLNRLPDPSGLASHLAALDTGADRMSLLRGMKNSPEAKLLSLAIRMRNHDLLRKARVSTQTEPSLAIADDASADGNPPPLSTAQGSVSDVHAEDPTVALDLPPPAPAVETAAVAESAAETADKDRKTWVPARHINELLALEGDEFIYKSYVSILNRLPDQEGLAAYRQRLDSGASKIRLLKGLKMGAEGRQQPLQVGGFWRVVTTWYVRTLNGFLG
jgi:GT2 family glycosyltransferase